MRGVRVPVTLVVVAGLLGGCGGDSRKPDDAPPECECAGRTEESCDCPHCMSRDGGMEPARCPCAGREYK